MSFYVNGYETPVIVDDYLPVRYGKPCFANSREGELWVILLEKAWAKLQGSYARTESGLPSFAICHLMDISCETIFHSEIVRENFLNKLIDIDKRNFIFIASSIG